MKLQELLHMFPGIKQLTKVDISQIELNKVSVLDAPDFYNWASPNELPITTGYIFHKDKVDLKKLVALYKQYNIIGLGIKIDRFVKELPEDVLEYADRIQFPVIYIPNKYSFSDIMIPVTNTIMNEKIRDLQTSDEIVRNLINLGLEGRNTHEVIDYLYQVTKVDLVFFNDLMQEKIIKSVSEEDFTEYKTEENITVYPLRLGNRKLGKIVLNTKEINLSVIQHKAVEFAVKVILLIHKEKMSMQQVEEDYKRDLVSDICHGNLNSLEELKLRSSLYGWDIADDIFVVIFDIDNYKAKTVELGTKSKELNRIRADMYKFIIRTLKQHSITYYTYNISDRYIFIFEEKDFESNEEKKNLLHKIKNTLYEEFDFTLTIAQGSVVHSVLDADRSFQQALDTVKVSRILYGNNQVVKYEDIELYTLMAGASQQLSGNHSILDPVIKIVQYDAENSSEYFQTLANLIHSDWSITALSKKEFIHYNTARYRFEKIEDITGVDLKDGKNKFNLEFSYKLYQIKLGLNRTKS